MSGEAAGEDPLARATVAVDDLYLLRDTYFPAIPDDKTAKLQTQSDLALSLLDSIPPEQRKLPLQRATYEYLRGKILDVFSDYRKEAEDHLSKAVKLNPSLADAWLCLGNCIWKKGDLSAAKNCFILALSKTSVGSENQAEIIEESIQHAKEAVTLDVKDGNSWYNLGNACLTSFFVTGAWDHDKLRQSLKAYQNARDHVITLVLSFGWVLYKSGSYSKCFMMHIFQEKDQRMKSNPDLYFNCATVNKYLENYERALTGFEAAALKDPGLKATEEVQKIVNLLDKIDNLLGYAKAKRLASIASSLTAVNFNSSYRKGTIDDLLEGMNKGVALVGKVLFFIKHENVAPLYYLICDSKQTCFILSVYGVQYDVVREGDQLAVLEPFYRHIDLSWKEKDVLPPSCIYLCPLLILPDIPVQINPCGFLRTSSCEWEGSISSASSSFLNFGPT
ncbi:hypothetical protein TIFTF001_007918 [Ficus carica]|uniref:Tetratricopeptide repeat protein 5 OB fold domain-containing protein n=1 Tax=Ficus carica TaxID=3494 RepID=A0AA88CXJ5_FICCA|nr:hypothetical protein TIFTF001_007918 [Ficus carica]